MQKHFRTQLGVKVGATALAVAALSVATAQGALAGPEHEPPHGTPYVVSVAYGQHAGYYATQQCIDWGYNTASDPKWSWSDERNTWRAESKCWNR